MKTLSYLKDKVLFFMTSVVRNFWRIFGREYVIGYDESHGSDWGCYIEGYFKKGKLYIIKEEYVETNNNLKIS